MNLDEIRRELDWRPGSVHRWVSIYLEEAGKTKDRAQEYDEETVGHLRAAHDLMQHDPGLSFRKAIQSVLGKPTEPIPAKSITLIDNRLSEVEKLQTQTIRVLNSMELKLQGLNAENVLDLQQSVDELLKLLKTYAEPQMARDELS